MSDDNPVKHRYAKSQLGHRHLKGKTTAVEVARKYVLTVSEIKTGIDEAQPRMENELKVPPKNIREQYEFELRKGKETMDEAHLQVPPLKTQAPARRGRELVRSLQVQLTE